eukprot:CAMPEP_0194260372 /NCGR_PEP_ID=MMETSP0158-20130606/45478_1 /TAXON_ID=33649 /ORGANISM="Thalassionema nitzschioides, Strain L26-B" /LENGTH=437 /DNA_ID=CAMNT_0039000461 /DNA_START=143 /DNA_END=1457 /DNA_ORIENTATION=+
MNFTTNASTTPQSSSQQQPTQNNNNNTPQEFFQETLDYFETDDEVVDIIKAPPLLTDELLLFEKKNDETNLMVLDEIHVCEKMVLRRPKLFYEELEQLDDCLAQQESSKRKERTGSFFRSTTTNEKKKKKKFVLKAKSLTPLVILVGLSGCGFLAHTTRLGKSSSNNIIQQQDDVDQLADPSSSLMMESDTVGTTRNRKSWHNMIGFETKEEERFIPIDTITETTTSSPTTTDVNERSIPTVVPILQSSMNNLFQPTTTKKEDEHTTTNNEKQGKSLFSKEIAVVTKPKEEVADPESSMNNLFQPTKEDDETKLGFEHTTTNNEKQGKSLFSKEIAVVTKPKEEVAGYEEGSSILQTLSKQFTSYIGNPGAVVAIQQVPPEQEDLPVAVEKRRNSILRKRVGKFIGSIRKVFGRIKSFLNKGERVAMNDLLEVSIIM